MKPTRWQQRFENFEKAFLLLNEPLKQKNPDKLSDLEKEGVIQRFEYTFELAWKTLKDYMEHGGIKISPITPREVIKQAFAANIISDGQTWINMAEDRNMSSHLYEKKKFEKIFKAILTHYLNTLDQFYLFFKKKDKE
ncbi:MAG: nucleotidyltransferase [Gammaproteobacteria bacterium RIFCSPLOWO2_02_FULL_38_11]|nr:MAG: nucleotidyltransferase [Gammaproteobacteria bacterium RIFCSPHIGHO2_02_FULL_38_33]OGT23608.1 MAG: nucleotidyltransferase [Gammaproteobacteria bacterium RIFCSPHIGHO2_12_38_15]OGT68132.1 MAG: nucleotidyltransferase [Gammaproteobacteria bacterium RIFCSPLOWO2_02_FULL_38_11]OGT77825.1 MAG: nucleotidyltransferase [Gammaproteobacteria bacterium RIFCSPLOWO2_12_FULL_38_14]